MKPEPKKPGRQEKDAANDDQPGGQCHVLVGVYRLEVGDPRGDEDRGGRGARGDNVPARAEDRVRREGDEKRVQAGLRGKPGEPRIRDHLGDEQAPDVAPAITSYRIHVRS